MICPSCRKPIRHTREYLKESGLDPDKYATYDFFEGEGCRNATELGFVVEQPSTNCWISPTASATCSLHAGQRLR